MATTGGASDRARAFIVEPVERFDLSSAATFGEITPLAEIRQVHPMDFDGAWSRYMAQLVALKFDPERDFIVHTGHSVLIMVLAVAVVSRWGSAKVLVFDSKSDRYRVRALKAPVAAAAS